MESRLSNAYAALGLPPGAGTDDVKAAFRQKALQCHPDVDKGSSEEFIRISNAYNFLLRKHPHLLHGYDTYADAATVARTRAEYASVLHSRRHGRAATVIWGVGLGLGCMLFGGILLVGRTMVPRNTLRGPSRVVEPSADSEKRQRIARLLMEREARKEE